MTLPPQDPELPPAEGASPPVNAEEAARLLNKTMHTAARNVTGKKANAADVRASIHLLRYLEKSPLFRNEKPKFEEILRRAGIDPAVIPPRINDN